MKIRNIEFFHLSVPVKVRAKRISWVDHLEHQIIIRATSDQGMVGVGESFAYIAPSEVMTVLNNLKQEVLNKEIGKNPGVFCRKIIKTTKPIFKTDAALSALSGIEIALWDLVAKSKNQPLWRLFGASRARSIGAYISLARYNDARSIVAVSKWYLQRGYSAVKLHETDIRIMKKVREIMGNKVIFMLDPNSPWNRNEAIQNSTKLLEQKLAWLEEPVWPPNDYASLVVVRKKTGITIATGENEKSISGFKKIIKIGAADIIQPSVAKIGPSQWRVVARMARKAGKVLAPHSFYVGPALAMTLHLAIAEKECDLFEIPGFSLREPLINWEPKIFRGKVSAPRGSGLGITLNDDVVKKYCL
jgi:L-alanine-DL-glutamate epimerase-like enolase superfamily enzyme